MADAPEVIAGFWDMLTQEMAKEVVRPFLAPVLAVDRLYWLYLLTALLIAVWVYVRKFSDSERSVKGWLRYCFPAQVYAHKSSQQDYLFFFANAMAKAVFVVPILVVLGLSVQWMYDGLESVFGPSTGTGEYSLLWYSLFTLLAVDFGVFITHYSQHKWPFLWVFHQVHHSAEVLNPVTVHRMHPVDLMFTKGLTMFFSAVTHAVWWYMAGVHPELVTVMGVHIVTFGFYLVGYNLRHTHIWFTFPQWLSYILMSPAQHQIHHSCRREHIDKNMGFMFAFWDWMWGTLYIPSNNEADENILFGVTKSNPNPFNSLWEMYAMPVKQAWKMVRKPSKLMIIGLAAASVLAAALPDDADAKSRWKKRRVKRTQVVRQVAPAMENLQSYRPLSLHVEELTWMELAEAQKKGFNSVIIPTGGTEQNGPHVVLGKHNYVVRHAATQVAERLGHSLVAPVLRYVPEGLIRPEPTMHMGFTGTLTLPDRHFAKTLEWTARSFKQHGFKNIFFMGDSYGNQYAAKKVAKRLSALWKRDGVRVMHVSDYYANNGQVAWLKEQGFTEVEIGGHAAIRDTSELMAVKPDAVRMDKLSASKDTDFNVSGANGAPWKATKELGEKLLELKVDAAVKQMRPLVEKRDYVVVLHGIARDKSSMDGLVKHVSDAGYDVMNIGYPSSRKPLKQLADGVYKIIKKELLDTDKLADVNVSMVTYSMGGIVLRQMLADHPDLATKIQRAVMLAPPNKGSEVADTVKDWGLYKFFYGPAGQELTTDSKTLATLPKKMDGVELGIIAGNNTIDPVSSWIIPKDDDGKVAIASTHLDGEKEHITLPATHTFIMNDEAVRAQVISFLEDGQFDR